MVKAENDNPWEWRPGTVPLSMLCMPRNKNEKNFETVYGLTENARHEIARHDKYRMNIDYITVVCVCAIFARVEQAIWVQW